MKKVNLTGQRFGRLTVVSEAERRGGRVAWACLCDCGAETVAIACNLTRGHTLSCGCLHREITAERHVTHGQSHTPEYKVWRGMRNRCENQNDAAYPDYGGRGIKVCERWKSFERFLSDMGARPDGMTIERNDVNGDYSPENCRWATMKEQQSNRRDTIRIAIGDRVQPLKLWCEELGVAYKKVHLRLTRYGYELNRALDLPAGTAVLT